MYYYNRFGNRAELLVKEGERVEIINRSDVYCINNEEPIFHSGKLNKINFEETSDGKEPVGMWVTFDKDDVFNDGEEEYIPFSDIEEVFTKKYEVVGYAMLNEGITLSVTGDNVKKMINFDYQDGNLLPVSVQEGNRTDKNTITEEDQNLIQEIMRYGTAQKFSRYVLTRSK